ncbi:MAG: hypothetical protein K6A90_11690 [Lachnospiraceae bacterium]|nr:hypothetical protein [Lachnospiraceae bacterium]
MAKNNKRIISAIVSIVLAAVMSVSAFAEDIPVIDMGTFHNVYHGNSGGNDPGNNDHCLGEISLEAHVELEGSDLEDEMFNFTLYEGSVSDENIVCRAKNDSNGKISFGKIKIYDVSEPITYIAVMDKYENVTSEEYTLKKVVELGIDNDGSIKVVSVKEAE